MTRALVIVTIVVLAFSVFTTVYAITADKSRVRGLPKWLWVLLCLALPIVGGILYLTVGRPLPDRRATGNFQTKTVAPDDDPDFLRKIRRQMDKDAGTEKQEKKKPGESKPGESKPGESKREQPKPDEPGLEMPEDPDSDKPDQPSK